MTPEINLDNAYRDNHILLETRLGDKLLYRTYSWRNENTTAQIVNSITGLNSNANSIFVDDNIKIFM